jgi:hypothetical protein
MARFRLVRVLGRHAPWILAAWFGIQGASSVRILEVGGTNSDRYIEVLTTPAVIIAGLGWTLGWSIAVRSRASHPLAPDSIQLVIAALVVTMASLLFPVIGILGAAVVWIAWSAVVMFSIYAFGLKKSRPPGSPWILKMTLIGFAIMAFASAPAMVVHQWQSELPCRSGDAVSRTLWPCVHTRATPNATLTSSP